MSKPALLDLTRKEDFGRLYRTLEAMYGREVTQLDIDRAFARYLKVTDEKETK